MNKKLIVLLTIFILIFSLVGCATTYQEATGENDEKDFCNGYFTVVAKWNDDMGVYRIVYANDTKVKYITISNGYKFGISPLYNADGTLQIYDGK